MWGYMMDGGGRWGGGMFMFSHILWWVFVLICIVALVRWMGGKKSNEINFKTEDNALGILRERYARGEIDKTEFEARKRDLQN